ncbi:hypothetical protein [Caballeronia sp. LZ001]|uniref:hypothetical protein n=1 Tax=Caballeronia sp. LZ001 TaxID=3038553 RepID=UPI002857441E|nr:hypothetical protein [Caballeronia sp. LZ001]MDR5806054.1 hypothetical protein [Caballeronia sp. LZ001]
MSGHVEIETGRLALCRSRVLTSRSDYAMYLGIDGGQFSHLENAGRLSPVHDESRQPRGAPIKLRLSKLEGEKKPAKIAGNSTDGPSRLSTSEPHRTTSQHFLLFSISRYRPSGSNEDYPDQLARRSHLHHTVWIF